MIKNGSEDGEVGNRSDFSIESLASQVKKMRECLVAEGWEVHKLLPRDWRVKVIAIMGICLVQSFCCLGLMP